MVCSSPAFSHAASARRRTVLRSRVRGVERDRGLVLALGWR
jgi:hypothetical protein